MFVCDYLISQLLGELGDLMRQVSVRIKLRIKIIVSLMIIG